MVRVRGYLVFSIVKLAAERQHVLVEASMPALQSFSVVISLFPF